MTAITDSVFMTVFLKKSSVLIRSTTKGRSCKSPCYTEGRLRGEYAYKTPFEALRVICFDSQHVEKDSSCCKKNDCKQGKHSQKEPGGTAAGLLSRLGDAKRSKKRVGEGFKKSHALTIRAVIRGDERLSVKNR